MKDQARDELFERARREVSPTDADRRRVRAALGRRIGVAAALAAGAAASKATASASAPIGAGVTTATATPTASLLTGATVAKLSLVLAVAGGAVVALRPPSVQTQAPVHAPARSHAAPKGDVLTVRGAEVVPIPPPAIEPIAAPDPSLSRASAPLAATPTRASLDERPAGDAPESAKELALVTAMQVALRAGDRDRVLALVGEHERMFPASPWRHEREGARVLAECGDGPSEPAKMRAAAFLVEYPRSPLAARVKATCRVE